METVLLLLALGVSTPDVSVQRAVALLSGIGIRITVPVVTFRGPTLQGGSSAIQGETDGKMIRVNTNTRSYESAKKGNAVELAASLAHEQFHVDHGRAEAPAYAWQISVLRALGSDGKTIRDVEKTAAEVGRTIVAQ